MERLFNLDAQLLFDAALLAIAVFVLFTLLSYLLFEPARKMLEKRKEKIKNDIDDAKADKAEAARLKEEYEQKLAGVSEETDRMLAEARKKALLSEERIVGEARQEAERVMERAEREVALEKEHALDDMKQEMIQIASAMAGKIVSEQMDDAKMDALLDETMKEMSEQTWEK